MRRAMFGALLWLLLSCGHTPLDYEVSGPPRDFAVSPAVVTLAAPPTVYAVSDIHGGYDRLVALLARNGVIQPAPTAPSAVRWSAGDAVLVVVGDLVDKGPQGLEVIEALQALEVDAPRSKGRVVVLIGNHEAEFFADPINDKASKSNGLDQELGARGIAPADMAGGRDTHGAWLRKLPVAARVGAWFFAHAGNSNGRSLEDLDAALRIALTTHPKYDDPELVGGDSILESRDWWGGGVARHHAQLLGARHIVMGHDPNAVGPRGKIAVGDDGAIVRIDCGMSPDVNDSEGSLLRIRHAGTDDVAESLDAAGAVTELWRGPG